MSDHSSLDFMIFPWSKGAPFTEPGPPAPAETGFSFRPSNGHFSGSLAWLPLLLLSAFQGLALGRLLRISFLFDFPVSVRFLLAIPLLIMAEGVVDSRVGLVVRYLTQSGLVQEKDYPGYHSAVRQVSRMCNSRVAEGMIAGFVILGVAFLKLEFWETIRRPGNSLFLPRERCEHLRAGGMFL